MLSSVYSILFGLFPPTIHPMVVHFTITVIYLAGLAEAIAFVRREHFYERAGFLMLGLGVIATIAAGVAGVISEHYDIITPQVRLLLTQHRELGEIAGVCILLSWTARLLVRYGQNPHPVPWYTLVTTGAAVLLVTYAGALGGNMVYDHGLGVVAALGRRHI